MTAALRDRFETRRRGRPFHAVPTIEDDGLVLGRGTVLARMVSMRSGETALAVDDDRERVLTLLSAVYGRQVPASLIKHVARASAQWRRGDAAAAHIELAFARFPRLPSDEHAFQLFVAEQLLADGMRPRELAAALGFDPEVQKYDPDQPRVPAGSGMDSGRWTSGGSNGGGTVVAPKDAAPKDAAPTARQAFLIGATPSMVEALAAFAARFSVPAVVLGALFIPTPNNSGVTEGTLPDAPDVSFRRDGPAGTLQLTTKASDGSDVIVAAQSQHGVYVDVATNKPIGRDLGEQLYLDFDAVQNAITAALGDRERVPDTAPASKGDEPKLCPAPTVDTPHGASNRANDYEDDVHRRVNPLAPLPRGFGVKARDPLTGRMVHFDDCFRYAGDLVDGDMKAGDFAEAKGKRYAALIAFGGEPRKNVMDELTKQADKQDRTAGSLGVKVKWYFAEPYAAQEVAREFEGKYPNLVIGVMPPSRPTGRRR